MPVLFISNRLSHFCLSKIRLARSQASTVKEEKNVLNLYLSKVASGDKSYLSKLVTRLADRLLFIPILKKSTDKKSGSAMKVNVYRHQQSDKEVIPVFTSEKNMQKWSVSISASFDQISVLGADLCTALGEQSYISIDEGTDHSVVFDPEIIIKIASMPAQEAETTDTKTIYLSPQQIVQAATEGDGTPAATPETGGDQTPAAVSRLQDWD